MRVLVGLSGGVDSSVAAARLVDAGHQVVGVHLALSRNADAKPGSRGCCTLDDARDARRVADMLGFPFYVWDLSERFIADVMDDFLDAYREGLTPNPCVRCNERIKFSAVLDRAIALGFDAIATGHYARIVDGAHGPELHRARDEGKDQSYVLGVLDNWQLRHSLFPLGESTKDEVREEARDRGLLVAAKPDSHDICFIPDGNTGAFLRSRLGEQPGDIVDVATNETVGHHDGAFAFTVGQRRGLNLTTPASDGRPRYVVDVDISTRTVKVGPPDLLDVRHIEADHTRWTGAPLGVQPCAISAQVRAHGRPVEGCAWVIDDVLHVDLDEPIRGLAPGQSVVLYLQTRVLGSGTVRRTAAQAHRADVVAS